MIKMPTLTEEKYTLVERVIDYIAAVWECYVPRCLGGSCEDWARIMEENK